MPQMVTYIRLRPFFFFKCCFQTLCNKIIEMFKTFSKNISGAKSFYYVTIHSLNVQYLIGLFINNITSTKSGFYFNTCINFKDRDQGS